MRALVTGACGFVGDHLANFLKECGDEVIGGVFASGAPARLYPTIQLDVSDRTGTIQKIKDIAPDVVYHLAGMAFVPEAEEHFDRALSVNVGGTHNVLKACSELTAGRLSHAPVVVVVSSAEVYGKGAAERLPIDERVTPIPGNNYSLSKLMAEMVAIKFAAAGGVRVVVARPFNHTGYGQNDRFVASNFAKQLALIAAGKAAPVIQVGNLDAKRDFCDVRDVVRGYHDSASHMLLQSAGSPALTVNLCSGKPVKIADMLAQLIQIAGVEVAVESDPTRMRPSDVPEFYGSYEYAKHTFNWTPRYSLTETLSEVYRYWKERV